ncbi:MAG: SCO family protein [Solirubrobacteraceae bacterium]
MRLAARWTVWWRAVVVAVALLVALDCSPAWADGDPASDVLLSQVSFLPADAGFSGAQQARLNALLDAAARGGYPVRVAVIPSAYDLGSITALWKKPETYARFLGAELSLVYKHPLVVVMPAGIGLNWPGHSVASAQREVAQVRVGSGAAGLLGGAEAAVGQLLSAAGVHLSSASQTTDAASASASASQSAPSTARSAGGPSPALLASIALAVAIALAAALLWPRLPGRRRRLVLTAVGGVVVVIGVPIAARPRGRQGSSARASSVRGPGTLYTLPEGRQPAPQFALRDQNGRTVSPAAFHGRDVLITFVDPLCRNLCPLEAHVLNQLVHSLPPARRPVIIAVSVDVYADARRYLLQDIGKWKLVPQWHWAIGSHAQLASVWRRYAVDVQVVTKRLAGTTVHYITHTEASILIDPAGYERALFAWPFSPQDVLATLRRVSHS